jgi:short-subunit dehydrogenase
MRIADSRILLTGASSGIGRSLSFAFAEFGARLALVARREERLAEVADKVESLAGKRPVTFACDVSDAGCVRLAVRAAMNVMGGIDILVNNAGISAYGDTLQTSHERFSELLAVNLLAPFHIMQEVVPHMRRLKRGLVVNVSSVAGIHGIPYLGAYGATKAGLVALSQSLRSELAGSGIGVMLVSPGYAATELFEREIRLGGARRPRGPYQPPDRLARRIVQAIERNRQDLDSVEGKVLRLLDAFSPRSTDRILKRMARRLKTRPKVRHAQT